MYIESTGAINHPAAMQGLPINLAMIPEIGSAFVDPIANYALYEMMKANRGYDAVFYPHYETKVVRPIGIGFTIKMTTVQATARLGKLNKQSNNLAKKMHIIMPLLFMLTEHVIILSSTNRYVLNLLWL